MSEFHPMPKPHLPKPSLPQPPEEPLAAHLRASLHAGRTVTLHLLREVFDDCNCWIREQTVEDFELSLVFEVSLREISELYLSLMEGGLEFDRRSHGELRLLCTLVQHAPDRGTLRKILRLQLDLSFADTGLHLPGIAPPLHA